MGNDMTDIMSIVIIGGLAYYLIVQGNINKILSVIPSLPSVGAIGGGGDNGGSISGGRNAAPGGGIKFSVAGDWGSGRHDKWKATVAEMAKFKPNAVVYPGDYSYTGPEEFQPVIDATKAFGAKNFGTNGNHDGSDYADLFDEYSNAVVNLGNVSFMLLDSEDAGGAVTFAKANFAKMTQKWKVAVFHKPIYTAKSDHGPDGGMKALEPEFEKAGIQLVLAAHNHNYNRFSPKNGVTYMVCGTGGESHYSSGGASGIVKEDDTNFGTTNFTTSGSSISGKFVANGGAVIDTFTITDTGGAKAAAYVRSYNTRRIKKFSYPYSW